MWKFILSHLFFISILLVSWMPNIGFAAEEIGRAHWFIAYDNGIVLDTKTGKEWIVGPDKKTTWDEAKSWVENKPTPSVSRQVRLMSVPSTPKES